MARSTACGDCSLISGLRKLGGPLLLQHFILGTPPKDLKRVSSGAFWIGYHQVAPEVDVFELGQSVAGDAGIFLLPFEAWA